ncbi:MFS transporter [Paenibacillus humicola]|uniref:MFS transporter n=1 Tax=Paenibacillus humicola TaxID=3110540 RepID=UPI00237A986F|nr:MFS transporter [Paenibacillus humicola]
MKELFRNGVFVKLFAASFASQMGATIGNMAFAFYLLDRFSSQPAYASLAELMYALPTLFVFFIVGVLADRFDRQRIAEYSGWIRVLLTAVLLGTIAAGWIPLVFAVLFLRSAVSKFYGPAESAMLQGIMPEEQYAQASGLNQMVMGVFMLFGVGLGAAAYQTVGVYGAVAADGCGLILSALLVRACRIDRSVRLPAGESSWRELGLKAVWSDFRDGLKYVLGNRLLLALVSGFLLFGLLNGAFAVLPVFTMKYKLEPDAYERFASLFAVFLGVGFLIGSAAGALLAKKLKPHIVMIAGLLVTAGLVGAMAGTPNVWVYLTLVLVTGAVLAPLNIAIGGWLPQIAEPAMMGRVTAWIDPVLMLGQSVALGVISALYPRSLSLEWIYIAVAAVVLISFVYYAATLPRLARSASGAQRHGAPAEGAEMPAGGGS